MARRFRAIIARDGGTTVDDYMTTEDGRAFPAGSFTWRTPPQTVMCQLETPEFGGHAGAFVLGRSDTITREGDSIVAEGEVDDEGDGEDADRRREAIRHIDSGALNGVSVDPAGAEVHFECVEFDEEEGWCTREVMVFDSYIIGAMTVVNVPAIEGTLITLDPPDSEQQTEGEGGMMSANAARDAVAASAAAQLDAPPREWFEMPEPDVLTPFTIDDDGRVYGHLASWDQCHIGMPGCVTAWRSPTDYGFFHLCGPIEVTAADGTRERLHVGPVSGSGGHYTTEGEAARDWRAAQAVYDDPRTCAAFVRAVDGELGPWVSGALRQGATVEQVTFLREFPPSGDWRRIGGEMELVGVCSVNVPGFPVRRVALAASGAPGEMHAVAAVIGLAHRGRCSDCSSEHETITRPRSLRAEAIDARLQRVEAAVDTLVTAFDGDVREKFRQRMRAH